MRLVRTLPLLALVPLAACAPPATTPAARESAEASLVAVEHAFEQATIAEGVRDAFIRFADDSAVIFRPEPVNAKASFRSRPATRIGLRWYPAIVRAARSGDLGFTSGPSQVLDSTGTVQGYGNYFTVWRRAPDGWHWVVDLGISTPKPEPPLPPYAPAAGSVLPRPAGPIDAAAARPLLAADSAFDARAGAEGFASALESYGDPQLWLLRNGSLPHVGLSAALAAAVADSARRYSAMPGRAYVSAAGDLGWSWGEYRYVHPGAGRRESGHYVRAWAREDGRWRLLADVVSPRPPERDE
jgi:hypothetical protein